MGLANRPYWCNPRERASLFGIIRIIATQRRQGRKTIHLLPRYSVGSP